MDGGPGGRSRWGAQQHGQTVPAGGNHPHIRCCERVHPNSRYPC